MPGVTVDGGDPVAVYEAMSAAVERARSGEGPTLVESLVYRLSAHGNIIAPPGRAAALPRARGDHGLRRQGGVRGRAARRPRPAVPRAARHGRRRSRPSRPTRSPRPSRRRWRRRSPSGSRARSRRPRAPPTTSTPRTRRSRPMARELPYIAAIGEAIHQEMERDDNVLYFGQNLATHDEDPFLKAFGSRPRPRDADLRDRRDRHGGRRGVRRLPAGRPAVHGRVHARRHGPGRERGAALPLHDGRPGQGADRAPGRLRLHRRLGGAAHRHDLRHVHGRARASRSWCRRRPRTPRA